VSGKEIWIPTTEVKVKIDEFGRMTTWELMTMKPKPIKEKVTGFQIGEDK